MTRVAAPALIVMIAVAVMVGAAGWNQSGDPRLTITLTERELPLSTPAAAPGDVPAMQLRIAYEGRHDPLDSRNWLPELRLREIGFPFHVPVGAPQAADTYAHVPPRLAWIVLEYDGPAWQDIGRRRALSTPAGMAPPVGRSRLVPVDAGVDFDALRTRYPSGHLIMRAIIGLQYVPADRGGPLLYGTLRELVPAAVAVPTRLRAALDELTPRAPHEGPRYEVELAIGSLGLPYVRAVRLVNSKN